MSDNTCGDDEPVVQGQVGAQSVAVPRVHLSQTIALQIPENEVVFGVTSHDEFAIMCHLKANQLLCESLNNKNSQNCMVKLITTISYIF